MTKRIKITYWVATLWLALGMVSSAIVQLTRMEEEVEVMARLGYPPYLLTVLGVWKILGVAAVLAPGFVVLKEWAYAGFFFVLSGAVISHIASDDPWLDLLPALLLLVLTLVSWHFRPANRRIVPASPDP